MKTEMFVYGKENIAGAKRWCLDALHRRAWDAVVRMDLDADVRVEEENGGYKVIAEI